jgi:DNA topoisomerase IB
VCRKYYIHPTLLSAYLEGSVLPPAPERTWKERQPQGAVMRHHEAEVLAFLKARLEPAPAGVQSTLDSVGSTAEHRSAAP